LSKLTSEVFNESCCDGGSTSTCHESAKTCGCDPGAHWVCKVHQDQIAGRLEDAFAQSKIQRPFQEHPTQAQLQPTDPDDLVKHYVNPLERHLHEVVAKTWNFSGRLHTPMDHVLNAVMGLAGEAGEVLDEHKKMFFHTPQDRRENVKAELGDVCYYLAKVLDIYGLTLDEVLATNRAKLFARHHITD
jgi:NTP pyrophosphatase (non-canonical NTP hydrolase)